MAALIKINEIACYGYHGVLPEEQKLGQEFRVSLELSVARAAPTSDSLSETFDYREAVEIACRILEGRPKRLLETLAEEIAAALLDLEPVDRVKVCVCKPHPPIAAVHGGIAVEINRQKKLRP